LLPRFARVLRRLGRLAIASLLASLCIAGAAVAVGAHQFSSEAYDDVYDWATSTSKCSGLSRNELIVMALVITYPETGAGSTHTPSPMTLSRYDLDSDLYAGHNPSTAYKRAFWHPGIGMWQLDDAGFASSSATWKRVYAYTAAQRVVATLASRYCGASGTDAQRRTAAWGPWLGCSNSGCESLYATHLSGDTIVGISKDTTVSRYGGMYSHTCRYAGETATFQCWLINPSSAEGYTVSWRLTPYDGGTSISPLTFIFYNNGFDTGNYEYRYWQKHDTGYANSVEARRASGANSRSSSGLLWTIGNTRLCDVTLNLGPCSGF
jgi:hypothetical protein